MSARPAVVGFWFDPVCPYSWTASRWLEEVRARVPLEIHHHVMSLYLLNEHRTDVAPDYRRSVEASRGPSRVAAALVDRRGEEALGAFYAAFGSLVFDVWRRPTSEEYHVAVRAALASLDLPADLEDAMESDEHDDSMRASHEAGLAPVGGEVGTPTVHIDGTAFYGPVLNAIPRGDDAVRVFEGARLLAGYPEFFELKRTRLRPPVFT
ncbi:disulfide bond formation protein DsbA [Terrabacter sp. LjRoot27]|uniref:mycothiol-dependent nitroreductase Rv2466c family protein n=1 Tax=Terrabacter sp. LjRoot27 TaxID=3342306 RepID=UPI003ECF115C